MCNANYIKLIYMYCKYVIIKCCKNRNYCKLPFKPLPLKIPGEVHTLLVILKRLFTQEIFDFPGRQVERLD